jgi:hypothetical protein
MFVNVAIGRALYQNYAHLYRGGHAQLFFESAITIPQLAGSSSAIAILQLFKNCCSATATPQSQFFLKSQLQVLNLRVSLPQFSAIFWPRSSLKLVIFYHQVFYVIERILKGQ